MLFTVKLHMETKRLKGGVAEWLNAPVLKTGMPKWHRGFESHLLRHFIYILQSLTGFARRMRAERVNSRKEGKILPQALTKL